jgi:hypothetical protein
MYLQFLSLDFNLQQLASRSFDELSLQHFHGMHLPFYLRVRELVKFLIKKSFAINERIICQNTWFFVAVFI